MHAVKTTRLQGKGLSKLWLNSPALVLAAAAQCVVPFNFASLLLHSGCFRVDIPLPFLKPSVAMETAASTPEAQCQALARKVIRELKNPMWNVPDQIQLNPAHQTTIGRCPSSSVYHVMMHSPKLPSMLSRKHASIQYNPITRQWVVEDLEVGSSN